MLDHVKLTVPDLERSKKFYEQALAPLGFQVAGEGDGYVGMGAGDHSIPDLWLGLGDVTSSTHVAFRADRAGVRELLLGVRARSGWPQHRGRLPYDGPRELRRR